MNKHNLLYTDMLIGLLLTAGILEFISGEFAITTLLLGLASLASNLDFRTPVRV